MRRLPETMEPDPWWGHISLDGMIPLISDGTPVFAEEESLTRVQGAHGLIDGVTTISRKDMAAKWASYESILFF